MTAALQKNRGAEGTGSNQHEVRSHDVTAPPKLAASGTNPLAQSLPRVGTGQQSAIVAGAQDWARAQPASRPVSGQDCPLTTIKDRTAQSCNLAPLGTGAIQHEEQSGNLAGLQTISERAATSGAGGRTQRMADKVARAPGKRIGRPQGATSSILARWLRIEIKALKRDSWTCRDAFQILVENNRKTKGDAFVVGAETASEVIHVISGDIKGRRVSFEYFRKLWREA